MAKKKKKARRNGDWFGCSLFLLCNFAALIFVDFHLDDNNLPSPKPHSIASTEFSEERAFIHLQTLASFGIRSMGSFANELKTPNYILDHIQHLNDTLHQQHASSSVNKVEVDVQKVSGTFALENFLGGFVNTYQDTTNVLVRVSNPNRPETLSNAILISAHFDTALGCSGMSDDGINIAVMMELIRNVLYMPDTELNVALIFNFNGGEETILQAAHGFITQHPWSESVRLFINLEASGAGGSEILFQVTSGHGWLVDVYERSVPYPHAHSIGNVIFSSGIIPSLTDFTIYTEYGQQEIPGLDFAFADNGYVYHTTKDNVDEIDPGSVQHCGDNMLALLRTLNADLNDAHSYFAQYVYADRTTLSAWQHMSMYDNYVFYDMFGAFMVAYPYRIAIGAHCILCIAFVALVAKYFWNASQIAILMARILVCNACGVLGGLVAGATCMSLGRLSMSWFSYPFMSWFTFGLPCIVCVMWTHHRFHTCSQLDAKLSPLQLEQSLIVADATWWYLLLALITVADVGASGIAIFWCVAFLSILVVRLRLAHLSRQYRAMSDALHCLLLLLPICVIHLLSNKILNVFVPIMGRAGNTVLSDVVIGALIAVCACLCCSGGIHFLYRLRAKHRNSLFRALWFVFAASMCVNLVHETYTIHTPKRLWVQLVTRTFANHSRDGGLLMHGPDALAMEPLKGIGIDRLDAMPYVNFNHYEQPWYLPVDDMLTKSIFIAIEYDDVIRTIPSEYRTNLTMLNQTENVDRGTVTTFFRVRGPSHMSIRLDATRVHSWSFDIPVFHSKKTDDSTVFVFIAHGYEEMVRIKDGDFESSEHHDLLARFSEEKPVKSDIVFWLETKRSQEPFLFSFSGHHINGRYARNTKVIDWVYDDIMAKLPAWADAVWFHSELIQVNI